MTLVLMQRILQTRGILSSAKLLPTTSTIHLLNSKNMHITQVYCENSSSTTAAAVPEVQVGFTRRMLKKIGFLDLQKYVIKSSYVLRFNRTTVQYLNKRIYTAFATKCISYIIVLFFQ